MNIDFARQQMLDHQVRAWAVLDRRVLEVLGALPREKFVPSGFASLAFADTEIPIGHSQVMMTPTVEGRLLQALDLDPADSVLEIGTGSGFLTACLANLAASVISVDIFADFVASAAERLEKNGIGNIELAELDATRELPAGPFDAIAVTGSIQTFDPRYVMALKPGGRLYCHNNFEVSTEDSAPYSMHRDHRQLWASLVSQLHLSRINDNLYMKPV